MMSRAHHTVSIPPSVADQFYRQVMKGNIVANLLKWPRIAKWRNAIHPNFKVLPRQPGRHRNHILLGHAGIDESRPQGLLQCLQRHESQITGKEHHLWFRCSRHQGIAKLFSHLSPTSSNLDFLDGRFELVF